MTMDSLERPIDKVDVSDPRQLETDYAAAGRGPVHGEFAIRTAAWPGDPPFWIFIFGDLVVFAVMFLALVHAGAADASGFDAGHAQLEQPLGLAYTLLLLLGSWFVATGIPMRRSMPNLGAQILLLAGAACGVIFCGLKIIEYRAKFASGLTPTSSTFFSYYFALTGIHLLHVVIAVLALTTVALSLGRSAPLSPADAAWLTSTGLFWHLVDLLWVFLYALFYLLRYPA